MSALHLNRTGSNLLRTWKLLTGICEIFWLTTMDDFDTFVIPNTVFGISAAVLEPRVAQKEWTQYPFRLVLVISFNWSNLLIFDLANQRLPAFVEEDKVNKPWRPIPANRMSMKQARLCLLVCLPLVWALNVAMGTSQEANMIFGGTWLYNDLGGGDSNWLFRNLLIACAFAVYNTGSLKTAAGVNELSSLQKKWIGLISCIIFTTMHIQDLKDQPGDRKRDRQTAPLVLGDGVARWTIAISVVVWNLVCRRFWRTSMAITAPSLLLGLWIAARLLRRRQPNEDRTTWKLWCGWTAVLYLMPLLQKLEQDFLV